jgi:hypothetical protein
MLERRTSDRVKLYGVWVKEENGEYNFSYSVRNISEEGLFMENKMRMGDQEPFSKLSFVLPGGRIIRNICARMVRENSGRDGGAAYEFLNMPEDIRIELKRFVMEKTLHGNA